ncbi:MAG: response regulator transcription factor [Verrucomicrobia bacterium]|nr:response regulator transcription factor [Verrucomicrobiota bacterium]
MKWDLHPSENAHGEQTVEPSKMTPAEPPGEPARIPAFRRKDETTEARGGRSVFLVVDRPVIREGLALVLHEAGFAVVGEAGNREETLKHPRLLLAEAVILELLSGGEDALGLIKALHERRIRSVVCSIQGYPAQIRAAFAAGASGYVTLNDEPRHLIEAIRSVVAGRSYVSPRTGAGLARKIAGLESAPPEETFSGQQWRVYQLLARGVSADEIATRIHVSPHTVESYCYRMIEKLNLAGMKALRRRAIIHGIGACL